MQANSDEMITVEVFNGRDGNFVRIPGFITTAKGTLVATCQHRIGSVSDSGHEVAISVSRSLDEGRTWTPQDQILYEKGVTFWQGALVEDSRNETLLLPYVQFPETQPWQSFYVENGKRNGGFWQIRSVDDGKTWSDPSKVTVEPNQSGWTGIPCNAVHGVQLSTGPHEGRFIIPAKLYKEREEGFLPGIRGGILYSDDGGSTWSVGTEEPAGSDESVLTEVSGGEVYVNYRYNKWFEKKRGFGRSVDGGATFQETGNHEDLVTPTCHAGITRVPEWNNGVLILSHPGYPEEGRRNLGLYTSEDEGRSWKFAGVIYPGPSGYSDIVATAGGTVICLFEKGTESAKKGEMISAIRIERDWFQL